MPENQILAIKDTRATGTLACPAKNLGLDLYGLYHGTSRSQRHERNPCHGRQIL